MAYSITYRAVEGQTGLYVRVQRKADGQWWDEVNDTWISSASGDCDISLTEDSNTPGKYDATANFSPSEGGLYVSYVYGSGGSLLAVTENLYKPGQMNALQIVNEVQKQLRLPKSDIITRPHAQLILSFVNDVMLNYMMEAAVLDELKVRGSFMTQQGIGVYQLWPVNVSNVDVVRSLQIGTYEPLQKLSDDDFREYKRLVTTEGRPLAYRHYSRAGGALLLELAPVPDTTYQVEYTVLQKPVKLVNAEDVPLLDVDTIIAGTVLLAKVDMGVASEADMAEFQMKLGAQVETQGETNFGDVEVV